MGFNSGFKGLITGGRHVSITYIEETLS